MVVIAFFPDLFSLDVQMKVPAVLNSIVSVSTKIVISCLCFSVTTGTWFLFCTKKVKFNIVNNCVTITKWSCWNPAPGLQKHFHFVILCYKYSYFRWVCTGNEKRIRVCKCQDSWYKDTTRRKGGYSSFTAGSGEAEARLVGKNYITFQEPQTFKFNFWMIFQNQWTTTNQKA